MPEGDRQIRAIVDDLTGLASRAVAKIALDITANLVETTPVDTGWARSNWVPSIGAPETEVAGSPDSIDQGAQRSGQASLLGYDIARGAVFVSNNVPYIQRLNDGSSAQAPRAFVQDAVDRAVGAAQRLLV